MQGLYAFIITTEDTDWRRATRFANFLLKFGKLVYWATEAFVAKTTLHTDGTTFDAGSFIVPLNAPTLGYQEYSPMAKVLSNKTIIKEADAYGVQLHTTHHSFDAKILVLRPTKVALFSDGGSPYPFADILGELGFQNNFVTAADIKADVLEHFHVLVIPGGGNEGPPVKVRPLGMKAGKN